LAFTKTKWLRTPTSPAVIALLIQLAALCVLTLCLSIAWRAFQFKLGLVQVLVSQAVLTLMMTRWRNLAWWWCVIQPLFPFAVALMLMVPVPSWLYLALFLFFLAFYWSTYRTQVPYFPSNLKVWRALEKILPQDKPVSLVDIGSGMGGLIMHMGRKYPESKFTGVEIAPLPWLWSHFWNATRNNGNTEFLRANYETLDFANFDVVFAYLSPAAMNALWIKAKKEMRPGTMLISYEFPVVGIVENLSIFPDNNRENSRKLYVWRL